MLSACLDVGAALTDTQRVSLLLYADDLVLLTHSASDLQCLLDALHSFSQANHMTENVSKSAVLVYGQPGWRGRLLYAGHALPTVDQFTYLGASFHAHNSKHGNFRLCMQASVAKAKVAMNVMNKRCRELGIHNVSVLCKLLIACAYLC